jgi:hypothetical protein
LALYDEQNSFHAAGAPRVRQDAYIFSSRRTSAGALLHYFDWANMGLAVHEATALQRQSAEAITSSPDLGVALTQGGWVAPVSGWERTVGGLLYIGSRPGRSPARHEWSTMERLHASLAHGCLMVIAMAVWLSSQTQKRLRLVQSELGRAKAVVRSWASCGT